MIKANKGRESGEEFLSKPYTIKWIEDIFERAYALGWKHAMARVSKELSEIPKLTTELKADKRLFKITLKENKPTTTIRKKSKKDIKHTKARHDKTV